MTKHIEVKVLGGFYRVLIGRKIFRTFTNPVTAKDEAYACARELEAARIVEVA